jgi:glucokinase
MRVIGIDLGGSKLLACLIDEDGQLIGRTVRPTGRATGPAQGRELIRDAAHELRERFGRIDAAGVGFPGVVDFSRGRVSSSVMLDGWLDVPLADELTEMLGIPAVVDNDVNCAAIAELKLRNEEAPESMLFVAVGTGIGGAITFGSRLWRGHTGVAGEIGNVTIDRHGVRCWCGRRGCLNTSASGSAIEHRLEPGVPLMNQVGSGHPRLDGVVNEAAAALGIGLANALNLLNPELVVLGGGVAQLGGSWLDVVAETARAEAFSEAGRCRFELARAGYDAGAMGAALLGLDMLTGEAARETRSTTSAHAGARATPMEPGSQSSSGVLR